MAQKQTEQRRKPETSSAPAPAARNPFVLFATAAVVIILLVVGIAFLLGAFQREEIEEPEDAGGAGAEQSSTTD